MKILNLQFQHGHWQQPLDSRLDGPDTLVLVFAASTLAGLDDALAELRAAYPQAVVLGCSSAGEIAASSLGTDSISAVVARFERTQLVAASTTLSDVGDSEVAGQRLADQLPADGLRMVFVLAGGVSVNGAALVRGLVNTLPDTVAVSGGLAGDGSNFMATWVLHQGQPSATHATAVGLYGAALRVGLGCAGGWQEFGPERRVTKAQGPVLHELDGQPALALYKHYLGDLAAQLPGSALLFPLSLRASSAMGEPVVRTILGIDEGTQTMTFAGDLPEGSQVRLMRTNVDRLVAAADSAGSQAFRALSLAGLDPASPLLALSISCIGRRLVMGERVEEELEAVVDHLPPGSVHAGFYSYGEIAPQGRQQPAALHNQTMTLTLLGES